jgi:hypothetical protein
MKYDFISNVMQSIPVVYKKIHALHLHLLFFVIVKILVAIDRIWIGNWIYCTLVTRYYTSQITIGHTKSSLAVVLQRLPTAVNPFPLGSRTVPGLSYQLLTATAHNN